MVNLRGIGAFLGLCVVVALVWVTIDPYWAISIPNIGITTTFEMHEGNII